MNERRINGSKRVRAAVFFSKFAAFAIGKIAIALEFTRTSTLVTEDLGVPRSIRGGRI